MREINLLLSFNIFISKDYTGLIELGIPLLDTLCKVSAYIFDWVQSKPSRLRVSFGGKAFVSCLSLFLRPKMIHIFMILRHFEKTALPAPTPDLCFQDFSALCVLSISWVKLFVLLISLLYCCVCTFFRNCYIENTHTCLTFHNEIRFNTVFFHKELIKLATVRSV